MYYPKLSLIYYLRGFKMTIDEHNPDHEFEWVPVVKGTTALLVKRLEPNSQIIYDPSEMKALAETIGYDVVEIAIQRAKFRSPFGIGKGKVQELKELIAEKNIDVVIFDDHIDPSRFYHLEQNLGKTVIDRYHLILQIFEHHSRDKISKLQIELARIRYEMPRYAEYVKRKLTGVEHPGFRSSGVYQVAAYKRMTTRRITAIKAKLAKIRYERQAQQKRRDRMGFNIVSLAGYYNAGKSSLHRALSGSDATVSAKPFTTLATLIRRVDDQILINDTVGFIDDLPLEFMDAFQSTLEEISSARLILLVLDAYDPLDKISIKYETCQRILNDLNTTNIVILVLSKADLIMDDPDKKAVLQKMFINKKHVFVSNVTLDGVETLKTMIKTILFP